MCAALLSLSNHQADQLFQERESYWSSNSTCNFIPKFYTFVLLFHSWPCLKNLLNHTHTQTQMRRVKKLWANELSVSGIQTLRNYRETDWVLCNLCLFFAWAEYQVWNKKSFRPWISVVGVFSHFLAVFTPTVEWKMELCTYNNDSHFEVRKVTQTRLFTKGFSFTPLPSWRYLHSNSKTENLTSLRNSSIIRITTKHKSKWASSKLASLTSLWDSWFYWNNKNKMLYKVSRCLPQGNITRIYSWKCLVNNSAEWKRHGMILIFRFKWKRWVSLISHVANLAFNFWFVKWQDKPVIYCSGLYLIQ